MLLPSALGFSPHPPVSVYGTGTHHAIAAFLGSVDSRASLLEFRSASDFRSAQGVFLESTPLSLHRAFHSRLPLSSCVPTFLMARGTGISTCCPSATPPGLALGPDLPRADQLYPGILGYSAVRILTLLSLLIPAFSLQNAPPLLIGTASSCSQCSSTTHTMYESTASVSCLSPGHFRRRTSRPVSYYALF